MNLAQALRVYDAMIPAEIAEPYITPTSAAADSRSISSSAVANSGVRVCAA